jgi:hypothetical protein
MADRDAGLETALRALAGVREAVSQLRAATAKLAENPITVVFEMGDGTPFAEWQTSAEGFYDHLAIPAKYRDGKFDVLVQMNVDGPAGVTVSNHRSGREVWRAVPTGRFKARKHLVAPRPQDDAPPLLRGPGPEVNGSNGANGNGGGR